MNKGCLTCHARGHKELDTKNDFKETSMYPVIYAVQDLNYLKNICCGSGSRSRSRSRFKNVNKFHFLKLWIFPFEG
jgi:hypothetical protein